jgi:mRNA interferase RelE/StbE
LADAAIGRPLKAAILSLDNLDKLAILSLMKTIILTLSAAKDLDALPRDAREQVEAGLHRYAMTGQGVKALQGRDGFRLRIGSYRAIFDEDAATILAVCIGRRATTTYRRS